MTFRQFIYRSVIRNKRLYAAFFFSSLFSVLVFFVYAIFAFHPALTEGQLHSSVRIGLHTAEAIIYVFAVFFVLYSLGSFLKSRKKEFGLLIMHGMTHFQLRRMVFMENVLIGLFSTLSGIGLGLLFAKAILMAAEKLLRLAQPLPFYWPQQAMLLTFGSFMLLFGLISLFTLFTVRSKNVIDLLKGSVAPKSEPRASLLLSLFGALLLAGGYAGALSSRGMTVVMAFVPVTIVVILGTYLLFTQLSVFVMKRLKNSQRLYWYRTNMLTFSDLTYRMKDNARMFFIVAIVTTVAFTSIGTLICLGSMLKQEVNDSMPFELQYSFTADTPERDSDVKLIRDYLAEHSPETKDARVDVVIFKAAERSVQLVPLSVYNQAAMLIDKEVFSLTNSEAIAITNNNTNLSFQKNNIPAEITFNDSNIVVKPVRHVKGGAVPLFQAYYIVTDELYAQLGTPEKQETYFFWQPPNSADQLQIGQQLVEQLEQNNPDSYARGFFSAKAYNTDVLLRGYSIILFIGLFIGIIFFVAAGSFLYFRLYQDLDDDLTKFKMITKPGLTPGELSRIASRQLLLLFFAPVVVALIHGAVALTALSHMFMQPLFKEAALVLSCFLVIQLVYFGFARYFYIRRIRYAIEA